MVTRCCFREARCLVREPVDVNTLGKCSHCSMCTFDGTQDDGPIISCVSLSNVLTLSEPQGSHLYNERPAVLHALLCPSHLKSYHEIHFFPWQLLYLPKTPVFLCCWLRSVRAESWEGVGWIDTDLQIKKEQPFLISGCGRR